VFGSLSSEMMLSRIVLSALHDSSQTVALVITNVIIIIIIITGIFRVA